MNKNIVLAISAVAVIASAVSGCSMTGKPKKNTQNNLPVTQEEPSKTVLNEYGLLPGHVLYVSPDNSFFIQLPEGHTVNDIDPNNISISLPGTFATPDLITITKSTTETAVYNEAQLYELLANDNTIDVTGFDLLKKEDGSYAGYQYDYVSYADPQLKGITSVRFSSDGTTAFIVDATINNGGDEINVYNTKIIVETFVNHL